MKKQIINIIVAFLFAVMPVVAHATIDTFAGSGSTCPGSESAIPITVASCNGVSAISLALNYDASKVTYIGYQNASSHFGSNLHVNASGGTVYLTWFSLNAVDFGNETLIEFRFEGINGTSALTWNTASCEYSDSYGNVIPSTYTNGSVSVYSVPTITSQPNNITVTEGQNATISVGATGTGLSYQWQVSTNGGTTWSNLNNGTPYNNVTTSQMSITSTPLNFNGNRYRCQVTGTCDPMVYSNAALLMVNDLLPTIHTTAGAITSCPSTEFSIPVSVTNCNNVGSISLALNYNANMVTFLGYDNVNPGLEDGLLKIHADNGVVYIVWIAQQANLNIGNVDLFNLKFESVSGNSNFTWNTSQCEYSSPTGLIFPTTFSSGSATVYYAPTITSHPSNRTIDEGNNTTFSVSASGTNIAYQWQESTDNGVQWNDLSNGTHYSNVNSATLTVSNVTSGMDQYCYRCQVTGTCDPAAYSNAGILHVIPFLPTIHSQLSSVTSCEDVVFDADLLVDNFTGVGSVSLTLTYNSTLLTYEGYENVNTALSNGTLLVNEDGGKIFISWMSVGGATFSNGRLLSLMFTGTPGNANLTWVTDRCEYASTQGQLFPTTYQNGTATIQSAPYINSHPVNRSIIEGENTTFSVSAGGYSISYQWQVSQDDGLTWTNLINGSLYSNVTSSTMTITNATLAMNGYRYHCVVSGGCDPEAISNSAKLTVNHFIPTINTTIGSMTTCSETEFSIPISVTNFNGVGAFSLALAYNPDILTYAGYEGVNYHLNNGELQLNANDGVVYATWMSASGANIGNGTLLWVKFTGDQGSSALNWNTTICEYATQSGEIIPSTFTNGSIVVRPVNFTIDEQPQNQVVLEGESTSFVIGTTGSNLTYVWQLSEDQGATWSNLSNDVMYAGVNTNTLQVNGVTIGMNGNQYRCAVNGGCGTQCSQAALLSVTSPYAFYDVLVEVLPEEGGTVTGAGTYYEGDTVTLEATANTGYHLVSWTENGEVVSTDTEYTFIIQEERNLIANFELNQYQINLSSNIGSAGTLDGGGTYTHGASCTIAATNNEGYLFLNWSLNGEVVSENPSITFTVTENANYVATFYAFNPAFANYVSNGLIMQVDGIQNTRDGHSDETDVWEDLVGFYDLSVNNYSSYTWEDNHFIGLGNGGYLNTGKPWKYFKSLTGDFTLEIVAYIDCDKTSPAYRGLAGWHVGSDGVAIQNEQGSGRMETMRSLPVAEVDDQVATLTFTTRHGSFLNGEWRTNNDNIANSINSNQTAVFGNSYMQQRGWNDSIYAIRIYNRSLTAEEIAYNHSIDMARFGYGVYQIIAEANPEEGGTVSGGGGYPVGTECTLTATPNEGYTFVNWTENDSVVSTEATYSFIVTEAATYRANFAVYNPPDYISDGLIMHVDGILNTRDGHSTTTTVWEDLVGNYDLTVNGYASYTWEDNHFIGLGNGGYLNTGHTWRYFNSLNNDITIEIVTYIDCDRTTPTWRGLAGWHWNEDGTNFQNDQVDERMETLGQLPVTEADDQVATVSYTRFNGSFLNGVWKTNISNIPNGVNSDQTVVFGNSFMEERGWNDSIYCIRIYNRTLTPEEIAYNHSIDVERFGASLGLYSIAAEANPEEGGTANGTGGYHLGDECTLTATPNQGYLFVSWTENDSIVSTNPVYTFTVEGNRTLVVNFEVQAEAPSGAINGLFSVGEGSLVYFAQGNLQYIGSAAEPYWKFAEHQWEYLGDNGQGSENENADRDLFAWGTSGYNHGALRYQPWETVLSNTSDFFAYGSPDYDLNDQTGQADWGYNAIINGGNAEHCGWRTPTNAEWDYLFNLRVTASGVRFAKARVNNVNGLIILPDNWSTHIYTFNNANAGTAQYDSNIISLDDWTNLLETNGVVFLPAAGNRWGTELGSIGESGEYWSATKQDWAGVYTIYFSMSYGSYNVCSNSLHPIGHSVRLIRNINFISYNIEASPIPTEGGTVTGMGAYTEGSTCLLTATPNGGYTFTNWTENDSIVSTEAEYFFTVTSDRTLVANFSLNSYEIVASASPEQGGTITGTGPYTYGSTATLTATANTGYTFVNWTEEGEVVSTDAQYSFVVTDDRTLVANFSLNSYEVSAYASPEEGGTVNGMGVFSYGATATLTATASTGYTFVSWKENGLVVSVNATYTFTVTSERTLEAVFSINSYNITASANPTNGGTVSFEGNYTYGSTFTVMASANTGYTFVNWTEGDEVVSTDAQYSFTVSSNRNLVANFSLNSYEITASANPQAGGTINGTGIHNHFETCTLTAVASQGYTFVNWTEDGNVVSTNVVYSFTVTGERTLVANFSLNSYEITATASPTEGGIITGAGIYNHFETCTLTATANAGYAFVHWTENGNVVSTSTSFSFTITEDRTLEAVFSIYSYEITATANPTEGGTVSGADTYDYGTTCTLIATANEGYIFVNWTENGNVISTDTQYSFIVTGNRELVANFEDQGQLTTYWTPCSENLYSQTSAIVAVILIDGVEQRSDMLELGIFCGDECRGTAIASLFEYTQRYIVYVNMFGENGHELSFRLYDHSIEQELNLTPPACVPFTEDGYGLLSEPFEANFTSTVDITATVDPVGAGTVDGAGTYAIGASCTLTAYANNGFQFMYWTLDDNVVSTEAIYEFTVTEAADFVAHFQLVHSLPISSGWSWWSTYIEQSGINGLQMLENSLGASGIRIQGKNASVDSYTYQGNTSWYGGLTAINNEQMFKIRTSAPCDVVITGDMAQPEDHPITINNGWNWIGFISTHSMSVATALSGFTPDADDIIKGRSQSATYFSNGSNSMWYGTLNTLEPGQGYMYKSSNNMPKTLVYPTIRDNEELKPNLSPYDNVFVPADENYADNMLITAVVEVEGTELRSEDYELAAFVGDECRGSVKLMYIEPLDRYVAFLLAFGDQAEHLHFVLTNGHDLSWSENLVTYKTDGTEGTLTEPVTLHFGAMGTDDSLIVPAYVYPNPSKGVFNVEGVGIRKIEVMDTYGQVILSEEVENDHIQVNLGDKATGAYLLRVVTDNGITTKKLVKE